VLLEDGDITYVIYQTPYEYVFQNSLLGFNNDFMIVYTCSECGFYSTTDGGS
jgi:hypothetical protein